VVKKVINGLLGITIIISLILSAGCSRSHDVTDAPKFWGGYVPGAYYQLQTNGVLYKALYISEGNSEDRYLLLSDKIVDTNNWPSFTNEWSCFTNLSKGTVVRVDRLERHIMMAVQWDSYIEIYVSLIVPRIEGTVCLGDKFSDSIKFSGDVYTFLSTPNTNLLRRMERAQ
jgi:hypothetical protein